MSCFESYCLHCRVRYHEGQTCDEFRISTSEKEGDIKFMEYVKSNSNQQCPNCRYWVSRA